MKNSEITAHASRTIIRSLSLTIPSSKGSGVTMAADAMRIISRNMPIVRMTGAGWPGSWKPDAIAAVNDRRIPAAKAARTRVCLPEILENSK